MKNLKFIFLAVVVLITILLIIVNITSYAKDRCQDYIPDVRQASIQYLGLQYPYWYNIGCMISESNCRPDIVSFDGGIGLYQFTPSTGVLKDISRFGIIVDPYNAQSSIRGQAFYISRIKDAKFKLEKTSVGKSKYPISPANYVAACGGNLSDVYRFYNGGYWFFYEATLKPGTKFVCENREIFKYCVRSGAWVGSGKNRRWLSFCEVNYSYPEKIYKYSQTYKMGKDGIRFWYEKKTDEVIKEEIWILNLLKEVKLFAS